MNIEIPKEILEFVESEGYEVVDIRVPIFGESYISATVSMWRVVKNREVNYSKFSAPRYIVKKKEWEPELNQPYWYVPSFGGVGEDLWYDRGFDRERRKLGNCFKTKEQAQAAADALPEFYAKFKEES